MFSKFAYFQSENVAEQAKTHVEVVIRAAHQSAGIYVVKEENKSFLGIVSTSDLRREVNAIQDIINQLGGVEFLPSQDVVDILLEKHLQAALKHADKKTPDGMFAEKSTFRLNNPAADITLNTPYEDIPLGSVSLPLHEVLSDENFMQRALNQVFGSSDMKEVTKKILSGGQDQRQLPKEKYLYLHLLKARNVKLVDIFNRSIPPLDGSGEAYEMSIKTIRDFMKQAMLLSQVAFFDASAVTMHRSVYEPKERDVLSFNNRYIEFVDDNCIIIDQNGKEVPIKAIWFYQGFNPNYIARIDIDDRLKGSILSSFGNLASLYHLEAYNQYGQIVRRIVYDLDQSKWLYDQYEACPYGECDRSWDNAEEHGDGYLSSIACTKCKMDLHFWASFFRTACRIIRQDFAVSPEPAPYETTELNHQEHRNVTTERGKKKHKVINRTIRVQLVRFDASVLPARQAKEERESQARWSNWLVTTPKDEIIYEKKKIERYERTSKLGKHHSVPQHEKYVPYKREPLNKAAKHVTASRYEDDND